MTDILSSIRTVKLYAWELALSKRLWSIRNTEELPELRRQGFLTALESGSGSLTPFLVAFVSFAFFAAFSGQSLTADIAFPALALFAVLQGPLQMIAPLFRLIVNIRVSLKRITALISAREVVPGDVERLMVEQGEGSAVVFAEASFAWYSLGPDVLTRVDL